MKKLLLLSGLLVSCSFSSANESVKIQPKDASEWLAKTPEVQVVDVRTTAEFTRDHLPKAVLIPWMEMEIRWTQADFEMSAKKQLDPKKPVLVYCRSGRRSAAASSALSKLGFTMIRDLDGGIVAWEKAGQSVVKPE